MMTEGVEATSKYKRRLDANLRMFNRKINDLLQDGLKGVNSLCNRVKRCLSENEMREYMSKCGHGDAEPDGRAGDDEREEKSVQTNESSNTEEPNESRSKSDWKPEGPREPSRLRHARSVRIESVRRPFSRGKRARKCRARGKPAKAPSENESAYGSCWSRAPVDRRVAIDQMERDYQKVMRSLSMVEELMASLNDRAALRDVDAGLEAIVEKIDATSSMYSMVDGSTSSIDLSVVSTTDSSQLTIEKIRGCAYFGKSAVEIADRCVDATESVTSETVTPDEPASRGSQQHFRSLHDKMAELRNNISALRDVSAAFRTTVVANAPLELDSETDTDKTSVTVVARDSDETPAVRETLGDARNSSSVESEINRIVTEYEDCLTRNTSMESVNLTEDERDKLKASDSFEQIKTCYFAELKRTLSNEDEEYRRLYNEIFSGNDMKSEGEIKGVAEIFSEGSFDPSKLLEPVSERASQTSQRPTSFERLEDEILREADWKCSSPDDEEKQKQLLHETESIAPPSKQTKPQKGKREKKQRKKAAVPNKPDEVTPYFSSTCFSNSSSSVDESIFTIKEKKVDPLLPVAIQCRKMMGDLVTPFCLSKFNLVEMLKGQFNRSLIERLKCEAEFKRRLSHAPSYASTSSSPWIGARSAMPPVAPEVRRKKGVCDLYDRMQLQIRHTDSFDGFLNLMNRAKRRAMIARAERVDHSAKLRVKYLPPRSKRPSAFCMLAKGRTSSGHTASVKQQPPPPPPPQPSDRDVSRKYVNSLWFSPRDFKLRRNSRLFNEQRMELYCKALYRTQRTPKRAPTPPPSERHTILVQSSVNPATHRIYKARSTNDRGGRSPLLAARRNLNHCDILDDLTIRDLEPFKAEYPRKDARPNKKNADLRGSLFYKLATVGERRSPNAVDETALAELVAPKITCSDAHCKKCKRLPTPRRKKQRGSDGNDTPTTGEMSAIACKKKKLGRVVDYQALSTKQATQLLVRNISEIKAKKSQLKGGHGEKRAGGQHKKSEIHLWCRKRTSSNKDSSTPGYSTDDSKSSRNRRSGWKPRNELARRPALLSTPVIPNRKKRSNRLLPYLIDPTAKIFQMMTVLPVKVYYDKSPITMMTEYNASTLHDMAYAADTGSVPDTLASVETLQNREFIPERPSTGDGHKEPNKKGCDKCNKAKRFAADVFEGNPCDKGAVPEIKLPTTYGCYNNDVFSLRSTNKQRSSSLGPSTESEFACEQRTRKLAPVGTPRKRKQDKPALAGAARVPSAAQRQRPLTPPAYQKRGKQQTVKVNESRSLHKSSYANDSLNRLVKMTTFREKGSSLSNSARYACKMCEKYATQKGALSSKSSVAPTRSAEQKVQKIAPAPLLGKKENKPTLKKHKAMMDHLHTLKLRNANLQNNIQKAIDIIEDKMYEVLSTHDKSKKKDTISDMEREVNDVLKMINEESFQHKMARAWRYQHDFIKEETETSGEKERKIAFKLEEEPPKPVAPPSVQTGSFVTTRSSTESDEKFAVTNAIAPPPGETRPPPTETDTTDEAAAVVTVSEMRVATPIETENEMRARREIDEVKMQLERLEEKAASSVRRDASKHQPKFPTSRSRVLKSRSSYRRRPSKTAIKEAAKPKAPDVATVAIQPSPVPTEVEVVEPASPFAKALEQLRAGKLIAKPNEANSFGQFVRFLNTLSETGLTDRSAEMKLAWNPEKRTSFHGTIQYCRSVRWRKEESVKALSDHSMFCNYSMSSTKKPSKTDLSEFEEKATETVRSDKEIKELYKNPERDMSKTESVSIVITTSDNSKSAHRIDEGATVAARPRNVRRFRKKAPALPEPDDRHRTFLKYFYVCYYVLVYVCLATLNFV